jgi:two-component system, LytTR family, sensor kinase
MSSRSRARAVAASELQVQLVDAELRALRMQLEPHFLFNSLNAVQAHIREEPDVAEEMLRHISTVLRSVLSSNERPERSVRDELVLVRAFLRIHEIRFGQRLMVSVSSSAECEEAQLPTLLLQPLVENAIVHGVGRRPGTVRVAVHVHRDDSRLVLRVEDAGLPHLTEGARPTGHHVGLVNTRQRLAHHYGEQFDVRTEGSDSSTAVVVSLPFVTSQAA